MGGGFGQPMSGFGQPMGGFGQPFGGGFNQQPQYGGGFGQPFGGGFQQPQYGGGFGFQQPQYGGFGQQSSFGFQRSGSGSPYARQNPFQQPQQFQQPTANPATGVMPSEPLLANAGDVAYPGGTPGFNSRGGDGDTGGAYIPDETGQYDPNRGGFSSGTISPVQFQPAVNPSYGMVARPAVEPEPFYRSPYGGFGGPYGGSPYGGMFSGLGGFFGGGFQGIDPRAQAQMDLMNSRRSGFDRIGTFVPQQNQADQQAKILAAQQGQRPSVETDAEFNQRVAQKESEYYADLERTFGKERADQIRKKYPVNFSAGSTRGATGNMGSFDYRSYIG
jgi:hypothetical protein